MDKYDARVYLGDLEDRVDKVLRKWKKFNRIEDQDVIQLEWQFEMSRVILDAFWGKNERLKLECHCSRLDWKHEWDGFTAQTANYVMDRIGNFAQIVAGKQRG